MFNAHPPFSSDCAELAYHDCSVVCCALIKAASGPHVHKTHRHYRVLLPRCVPFNANDKLMPPKTEVSLKQYPSTFKSARHDAIFTEFHIACMPTPY